MMLTSLVRVLRWICNCCVTYSPVDPSVFNRNIMYCCYPQFISNMNMRSNIG